MVLTATLIGAVTVGDMVASIIASYAANHIPSITHPDLELHAIRCYEQATEKFRVESDVHAAIFPKVSTIEKWKEYMNTEDSQWVNESLIQLWIEELLADPLCQAIGLHKQLESVESKLKGIEHKVNENNGILNQIKTVISRSQEKAEYHFDDVPQYIQRYCADFGSNFTFLHFAGMDCEKTLLDYVMAEVPHGEPLPRIALYGGMQRGKSTELEHLGWQLKQSGKYIPILYRIKYFKELRYEDLPGDETSGLPIVLLVDALDETSEHHFCNQLEAVSLYAKRHKKVRIVVSCRSNFRRSYLLGDFKSLELLPLRQSEIVKYVNKHLGREAVPFFDQIRAFQLGDLICQPLELQTLVEQYHIEKTLPDTRSAVYSLLYAKAINTESTKGVKDELITPEEELRCLMRVSLVMLRLGRRELTEDEFRQILITDKEKQFDHMRYGILDNTERVENEKGVQRRVNYVSFINNALMEYVASQLLLGCKGVPEIKTLTCLDGTNKVTNLWFNAMLLFLEQVPTVRPDLISELQSWLTVDGKELLIQVTDPAIISESQRGQYVIEFLKQCSVDNQRFVAYGLEWEMQTRDMPICLVQYLLQEWKTVTTIGVNIQNVQLLTRLINWNILEIKDRQLANDLEQRVLQNFSNPVFNGESVHLLYSVLTNDYFLTDDFTDRLFKIVSHRTHRVDYEIMTARLSKHSDTTNYVDYLMDAEIALVPDRGNYHILPREPLYTAIYKVNGRDAVIKALQVVARESFWRWAEKKVMAQQACLILSDKARSLLATTPDNTLAEALQKALEMQGCREIKPIKRTPEEQQRSIMLLEKEVCQLCDFIYFRGKARSWITSVEDKGSKATLDFMELYRQHAMAKDEDSPNHFIVDFLLIYGSRRYDDAGMVVLPALARRALNDESLYRCFRMRELYRYISGENKTVKLTASQEKMCYDQAQEILNSLIANVRIGNVPEDTPMVLSLLVSGKISITATREACRSLLHYVGIPFTKISIQSLYDELNDDSLVEYVCQVLGETVLLDLLHELVTEYCDHIGTRIDQRTMDIWTSYLIKSHHQPSVSLLTDKVIKCQTPLWANWMYNLVKERQYIPMLKARAEASDADIVYIAELGDDLMSDASHHVWIKNNLERYYNHHPEQPVSQKSLQMLLKLGSIIGLKFVLKDPKVLNAYSNYDFVYTDEASVPLLARVFNLGMSCQLSMIVLNSILTSLHNIAIKSETNLNKVQDEVIRTIPTLGPNALTTAQWSENLTIAYLYNLQKKQTIPDILTKVETILK